MDEVQHFMKTTLAPLHSSTIYPAPIFQTPFHNKHSQRWKSAPSIRRQPGFDFRVQKPMTLVKNDFAQFRFIICLSACFKMEQRVTGYGAAHNKGSPRSPSNPIFRSLSQHVAFRPCHTARPSQANT